MKSNEMCKLDTVRRLVGACRNVRRMRFAWLRGAVRGAGAGIAALVLAHCAGETGSPPPPEALSYKPSGVLSAGDVIRVSYAGAADLNQTQKIQSNGKVSLPMIGEVSAAGQSIDSFQRKLTGLYKPHLQDPGVSVSLEGPAATVYVMGEVNEPGPVVLTRPLTVLEAIGEAKGFTKMADKKRVTVIRNDKGTHRAYVLNMRNVEQSGVFYLRPNDVVDVKISNW